MIYAKKKKHHLNFFPYDLFKDNTNFGTHLSLQFIRKPHNIYKILTLRSIILYIVDFKLYNKFFWSLWSTPTLNMHRSVIKKQRYCRQQIVIIYVPPSHSNYKEFHVTKACNMIQINNFSSLTYIHKSWT